MKKRFKLGIISILSIYIVTACGYTDPFVGKTVDDLIAMNPDLQPQIVQEYYMRLKNAEEKLAGYDDSTDVDDYIIQVTEKAIMRNYLGDRDGAIQIYEENLKKYPNWGVGWNNVANLYEEKEDYNKTENARLKYMDLAGIESFQPYTDLATMQALKMNRLDKALKTIEFGKQRIGEHYNFYFTLYQIYKQLGDEEESQKNFQLYQEWREKGIGIKEGGGTVGEVKLEFE